LFMVHRGEYMNRLARDIVKLERQAQGAGLRLCVRLNGSTDIVWERVSFEIDEKTARAYAKRRGHCPAFAYVAGRVMTLPQLFPELQFVEYTKNPNRLGKAPANLDLTLSFSGSNIEACAAALANGHNVAVVFHGGLPSRFAGMAVIDGDKHDLRHLDAKGGYIVGLSPKGRKAKRDASGFVIDWQDPAIAAQWFDAINQACAVAHAA